MEATGKKIKWLYNEIGLAAVYSTGPNAWLIIVQRCARMFAYGCNSLILALFFSALNFTDFQIGLFMSLTLMGDILLGILLTFMADKIGRRKVLFAGACMMVMSGTTFALFENFWILLFAAVVGVISATGGDFGPFRAIEESTLSHLTDQDTRPLVLSWYVTTATLGSSIGTEMSGRIIDYLQNLPGWTLTDAYHSIFWMYTAAGLFNMVTVCFLSPKCELNYGFQKVPQTEEADTLLEGSNTEHSDDEGTDSDADFKPVPLQPAPQPAKENQSKFARISKKTRSIILKLWFLLIVDSLADGMVSLTLTNYYMDQKFNVSKSTLGDISSIGYFLASLSTIFAGPLSRRIGLINTMVFTHLPSSAAVLLFPAPQNLPLTVVLFFIRLGLNNMDQAPRSAFIAAVVKPEERTAVMGLTAMIRTLASMTGPTITGLLAGNDRFWIAFVTAGSFRIAYDLGLFAMFVNIKLHEHEENVEMKEGKFPASPRRTADEEEEVGEVGESDPEPRDRMHKDLK